MDKVLKKYKEWWALLAVLLVVAIFFIITGVTMNMNECGTWWC